MDCFPHASGGVSVVGSTVVSAEVCSPREWGCF